MKVKVCPTCRKPVPEFAKFCEECGARIDVQMMRKELDEENVAAEYEKGLVARKSMNLNNPFCSKQNKLKRDIINPVLKPLPKRKQIVYMDWEAIKREAEAEAVKREAEGFELSNKSFEMDFLMPSSNVAETKFENIDKPRPMAEKPKVAIQRFERKNTQKIARPRPMAGLLKY